ncbi:MAG: RagB/SusD family nutrient uptake outer membrane protein, partial [Cytophagales bacterium]|nr:RagB/SusD family nutrient uptake outer membrane protein [Cytophagales bacterium]
MKKFLKYAGLGMFIMLMTTGCNDDFLERFPLDELTNETFWNSEADLRAFVNKLYPSLGNGIVWTVDDQSDNQAPETFNTVAAGLHTIDNGSWNWSFLRDCNFFLENFDRNPGLDQSVKDRYQGEVLAFRANWVFSRIKRWGDIPFTTRVLTNQDTEELFGERVPRKVVMEQVLEDLTRAAELIPPTAPEGRLTKWAALALKA